jgi:hypothetical protein
MTVITDLTGLFLRLRNVDNPAGLAIHLRDHVVKYLNLSMDEPWQLTGHQDRAVGNLIELGKLVGHLIEILMALAADAHSIGAIRRAGSQGGAQALVRAAETAKRVHDTALDRRCQIIADAVAPTVPGSEVEVRGEEQDGFTRFVVAIETTSLFGYILEQQDTVSTAIQSLNRTMDQFIAVPTRSGKRFVDVGIQVIMNASAGMSTDGWEQLLPEVHPNDLNVTVRAALDGLVALSGITDLPEDRQNHPDVVAFAEATVERVRETIEQLADSGDELAEAIVVDLLEIVGRVNEELGGRSVGETYASAVAGALNSDPTPEIELMSRMHLCALLWPVDPAEVKAFLGWTPATSAP